MKTRQQGGTSGHSMGHAGAAPHTGHVGHHAAHQQQSSLLLWMLVDGVGLAMIAGCTILEGMDLWNDFFSEHYASNHASMAFWVSGRSCQVLGLLALIAHAATLQIQPELERAGMVLLTAGPILNICACSLFSNTVADPYYLFNRAWLSTETIELLGITVLDLSLIDADHTIVLSAEVAGFSILACAAILDFDFSSGVPEIGVRLDMVHVSDCFGLFLLTVVAVAQYFIKESKHVSHHSHHQQQHGPNKGR